MQTKNHIFYNPIESATKFAKIFFFIAPFYWAPLIPYEILSLARGTIIAICITLSTIHYIGKNKKSTNEKILFPLFILTGIVYQIATWINPMQTWISTIIYIATFFYIGHYSGKIRNIIIQPNRTDVILAIPFTLLCIIVSMSKIFPSLDIENPFYNEIVTESGYIFDRPYLSSTGFNSGRTGWSISVFFVSMYCLTLAKSTIRRHWKTIFILASISAIISIATTASRGGFFYILVFSYLWYKQRQNKSTLFKLTIFTAFLIVATSIYYFAGEYLRLTNTDDITSGRIDGYALAAEIANEKLLFGKILEGGYSLQNYGLSYDHIHNAWLHNIINHGIIITVPLLIIFIAYFITAMKSNRINTYLLKCIIISGLISTFLEPESVLSKGHHILIFWSMIGYLSGTTRNKKYAANIHNTNYCT